MIGGNAVSMKKRGLVKRVRGGEEREGNTPKPREIGKREKPPPFVWGEKGGAPWEKTERPGTRLQEKGALIACGRKKSSGPAMWTYGKNNA